MDCSSILMAYLHHNCSSNNIYPVDITGELEALHTCSLCLAPMSAAPTLPVGSIQLSNVPSSEAFPVPYPKNPTSVLAALCPITPFGSFLHSIQRCRKLFCSFISWSNTRFLLLECKHNLSSLLCPETPNQVVAHGGHYVNARGERILFY